MADPLDRKTTVLVLQARSSWLSRYRSLRLSDVGRSRLTLACCRTFKRQMQQAADLAAIAGDREIYSGNASATEPTNAQNAALADVTQNGFTNAELWTQTQNPCVGSAGQTCVVVNAPPQSGGYANDHSAVEVIVRRQSRRSS